MIESKSLLICNIVLLFVFWYCHKRGRETRLASASLENSVASLDAEKGSPSAEVPDTGSAEDEEETQISADELGDRIEEVQIDAAVAKAKQEKPTEAEKELQDALEQSDPNNVNLPGSPTGTRA